MSTATAAEQFPEIRKFCEWFKQKQQDEGMELIHLGFFGPINEIEVFSVFTSLSFCELEIMLAVSDMEQVIPSSVLLSPQHKGQHFKIRDILAVFEKIFTKFNATEEAA